MGSTNTQSTGGRGYPRSRCQGQRRRHGPRSGLRSEGCFFSLRGNHEVHVAHSVFTQLGVDTGLFPSPGGLGCSYVQQGRPKRILGQPAHRNHTLPNRKRPPGGRPDERLQEERGSPSSGPFRASAGTSTASAASARRAPSAGVTTATGMTTSAGMVASRMTPAGGVVAARMTAGVASRVTAGRASAVPGPPAVARGASGRAASRVRTPLAVPAAYPSGDHHHDHDGRHHHQDEQTHGPHLSSVPRERDPPSAPAPVPDCRVTRGSPARPGPSRS